MEAIPAWSTYGKCMKNMSSKSNGRSSSDWSKDVAQICKSSWLQFCSHWFCPNLIMGPFPQTATTLRSAKSSYKTRGFCTGWTHKILIEQPSGTDIGYQVKQEIMLGIRVFSHLYLYILLMFLNRQIRLFITFLTLCSSKLQLL